MIRDIDPCAGSVYRNANRRSSDGNCGNDFVRLLVDNQYRICASRLGYTQKAHRERLTAPASVATMTIPTTSNLWTIFFIEPPLVDSLIFSVNLSMVQIRLDPEQNKSV